jgi:outer membrane receptor protein involved in Fe transport
VTQFRNVGAVVHQGGEISLRTRVFGLDYTYLNRRSESAPRAILFGTPDHSLSAYADLVLGNRLTFTPAVVIFSNRNTSDLAGGEPVDGFVRVDTKLSYRLGRGVQVELSAAICSTSCTSSTEATPKKEGGFP